MNCDYKRCVSKRIRKGEVVIQVRKGGLNNEFEFEPDEDVGYYHQKCYDEGLLVS